MTKDIRLGILYSTAQLFAISGGWAAILQLLGFSRIALAIALWALAALSMGMLVWLVAGLWGEQLDD